MLKKEVLDYLMRIILTNDILDLLTDNYSRIRMLGVFNQQ